MLHPNHPDNFWAGDAWKWEPPRSFTYVYSLLDLAPGEMVGSWLDRLASWVEPRGRLIIGSYGSKSRRIDPEDVPAALERSGLNVVGSSSGGDGPVVRFAWAQL